MFLEFFGSLLKLRAQSIDLELRLSDQFGGFGQRYRRVLLRDEAEECGFFVTIMESLGAFLTDQRTGLTGGVDTYLG